MSCVRSSRTTRPPCPRCGRAPASRFLWDDEIIPPAPTRDAIATSARLFAEQGAGLWSVRRPDAVDLVGFGGLWPFRDPPELELLYGVAEPFWGRGDGAEIGGAVLSYCFDTLAMPAVRASTDVANVASVRVLEKLLTFAFERSEVTGGLDTVFYVRPRPLT